MTDPTIPDLVARLRELHEKATPGPWSTNHRGGDISARIRGHEVQVALACGQGAMWDERDDAAAIMRANAELIAELRSALPAILDALDHVGDAAAHSPDGGKEEGEPGFGRDLHRARGAREMACFVRRLDIGRGFVRARECPDCFHTKCGESCVCNCDAAHAEAEAAHLRGQVENTTWRPIEECGELERGTYLVTLDSGRIAAAWHDELGWYCGGPAKPTHVHQMGPIRGPGETT